MNLIQFGAQLARLRKDCDMPQSALADTLNVTRQAVSKWERGEGFPDIGILCNIAEVFGLTVDALIQPAIAEAPVPVMAVDEETVQEIINIAPYLKVSTLSAIAEQLSQHNLDIRRVVELSEFMNDESLRKLLENSNLDTLDDALLARLIPFLDGESVMVVFDRILRGQNSDALIRILRPFINISLVEAAVLHGALDYSVLKTEVA